MCFPALGQAPTRPEWLEGWHGCEFGGRLVLWQLMRRVSRRWFFAATTSTAGLSAASRGRRVDSPREELLDGLTERPVYRLTDLSVLHHLPGSHHRFIARSNSFLLLAAEHGGSRQFHRLDLKRERLTQLTEGSGVHPHAAQLRGNDRGFFFMQQNQLIQADLNGSKRETHYECPPGWVLTGEMDISAGERYAAVIEMREDHVQPSRELQFEREPLCRVRVVELTRQGRGRHHIAAEERRWLSTPLFRPWRAQLLYVREGPWQRVQRRFQLVNLDGTGKSSLRPTNGREKLGQPIWAPDGSVLRYVHYPDGDRWSAAIRNVQPETRAETMEARCSAFGWLQENADGSAMVGASMRPSGPNIYVLFPRMRREITLAEHHSSLKPYPLAGSERMDPFSATPAPALSADSSWLYFGTDREGTPAVYGMPIDDLVEATAS